MNERQFKVSGTVSVDRDEVLDYLRYSYDSDIDDNYEPTDAEWEECAYDLFENDKIEWCDSELTPVN